MSDEFEDYRAKRLAEIDAMRKSLAKPREAEPETQERFQQPFAEAVDYFRQKVRLPTRSWRDLDGRAHDRAFVVAGATSDALLSDFQSAIDAAIAGGERIEQFRKRFDEIVQKHGWTGWTGEGSAAGRAWRTRVIYETNLRTAYAAGRYKQMTDPDMVKVRPYWQYRHGEIRDPVRPREKHVAWNGLVLKWDDPFWNTHYPPNDWFCSCGVRPISRRGLAKMGKTAPDEAPPITTRTVVDPVTGDKVEVPDGIGFGWDHAPGADWARGLVPREFQEPLKPLDQATRSEPSTRPMPPPRPFKAPRLADGLPPEDYARAFLKPFGADVGQPAMWRDPAGHAVAVSDDLFRQRDGEWKIMKRGRHRDVARLAEAVADPDEIWVSWWRDGRGVVQLLRTYLRGGPDKGLALFRWGRNGWEGMTAFEPDDQSYLEVERRGALVWRRED